MFSNRLEAPGTFEMYRVMEPSIVPEAAAFRVAAPAELGVAPLLLAAGRFLLPVAIAAGAVISGGLLLSGPLGFDLSSIAPAAVLAGAGVGAFVVSGILPETLQPFSTLAGIGLSVASLIVLFSGTAEAVVPPERREVMEPASEPAFTAIRGRIVRPKDFATIAKTFLGENEYTVELAFDNPSDQEVDVLVEIESDETPVRAFGIVGREVKTTRTFVAKLEPKRTTIVRRQIPVVSVDPTFVFADMVMKASIRRQAGDPARFINVVSFTFRA